MELRDNKKIKIVLFIFIYLYTCAAEQKICFFFLFVVQRSVNRNPEAIMEKLKTQLCKLNK